MDTKSQDLAPTFIGDPAREQGSCPRRGVWDPCAQHQVRELRVQGSCSQPWQPAQQRDP